MKVRGTIRKLGLEGGLWALIVDDGRTIELLAPPEALQVDGAKAEVEVDTSTAEVSIGMVGSAASVRSFTLLEG